MSSRTDVYRAYVAGIEILGVAAAVLDRRCRVLAANALLGVMSSVVACRGAELIFADPALQKELDGALSDRCMTEDRKVWGPISVPGAGDQSSLFTVQLVPLQSPPHSSLPGAASLLLISPDFDLTQLEASRLRAVFGFTRAEARTAQAIATGLTLDEIAERDSISRETLRTQLKIVFKKTGARRQAELASLLVKPAPLLGVPSASRPDAVRS